MHYKQPKNPIVNIDLTLRSHHKRYGTQNGTFGCEWSGGGG